MSGPNFDFVQTELSFKYERLKILNIAIKFEVLMNVIEDLILQKSTLKTHLVRFFQAYRRDFYILRPTPVLSAGLPSHSTEKLLSKKQNIKLRAHEEKV